MSKKIILLFYFLSSPVLANDTFYNRPHSAEELEKAQQQCSLDDVQSCADLAWFYEKGYEGIEKNIDEILDLYQRACNKNNAAGCAGLGSIYGRDAMHYDLTKNKDYYIEAARLSKLACDHGNVRGCNNYALQLANGLGITSNLDLAISLYKKACDQKYALACYNLGAMYYGDDGVIKNIKESFSLFQEACRLGNAKGCAMHLNIQENYTNIESNETLENTLNFMNSIKNSCLSGMLEDCESLHEINTSKLYNRKLITEKEHKVITKRASEICSNDSSLACDVYIMYCDDSLASDIDCPHNRIRKMYK